MDLFIFESYVNTKISNKAYGEELPEELLEGVPEGEEVTVPGVPAKEIPPGVWYLCLVVLFLKIGKYHR